MLLTILLRAIVIMVSAEILSNRVIEYQKVSLITQRFIVRKADNIISIQSCKRGTNNRPLSTFTMWAELTM